MKLPIKPAVPAMDYWVGPSTGQETTAQGFTSAVRKDGRPLAGDSPPRCGNTPHQGKTPNPGTSANIESSRAF
jgi:hypothetical protein